MNVVIADTRNATCGGVIETLVPLAEGTESTTMDEDGYSEGVVEEEVEAHNCDGSRPSSPALEGEEEEEERRRTVKVRQKRLCVLAGRTLPRKGAISRQWSQK